MPSEPTQAVSGISLESAILMNRFTRGYGVDYAEASGIKLRRKASRLKFRMALAGFEAEAGAHRREPIVTPAM